MAEGNTLRSPLSLNLPPAVNVDEAIRLIEAGKGEGLRVDLGGGRFASADTPRGTDGLLQRLRGHKMLTALSQDGGDLSRLKPPATEITVAPAVREILDAAMRKP
jgi:hypothetical protein